LIFERFFPKISRATQVSLKSDKNNRYCTWRPGYFYIIYRSVLLTIRNVFGAFLEKIRKHILCSTNCFRKSFFYKKMWKNALEPERLQHNSIIRCIRSVCFDSKATDVHSESAILIDFTQQRYLRDRTAILRLYVPYIASLVLVTTRQNYFNCSSFTFVMRLYYCRLPG
jgi:hypothetical protein